MLLVTLIPPGCRLDVGPKPIKYISVGQTVPHHTNKHNQRGGAILGPQQMSQSHCRPLPDTLPVNIGQHSTSLLYSSAPN